MEISAGVFKRLAPHLPVQRGNVSLSNLHVVNGILYVAQHRCAWRALPQRFGNWHTIYTRMNRWAKTGVLDRLFRQLQRQQLARVRYAPDAVGGTVAGGCAGPAGRRRAAQLAPPAPPRRFIRLPRIHAGRLRCA